VELLYSCLILIGGAACAWFYLRRPVIGPPPTHSVTESCETEATIAALGHARPWRRLGAAICLLLSVMFVLGIHLLDEKRSFRLYVAYWSVMMMLIVWLCTLAIRDILYTRQLVLRWRREREDTGSRKPWFEPRDEDLNP